MAYSDDHIMAHQAYSIADQASSQLAMLTVAFASSDGLAVAAPLMKL